MIVLSVAYPLAPVGPDAVGGAEQILTAIDRALVSHAHESIVVACEGSSVAGTLIATAAPKEPIDENARSQSHEQHRLAIGEVLKTSKVDLIHMHGLDFYEYLPESSLPVLVTMHLPLSWYPPAALKTDRPTTYFHCVSRDQESSLLNRSLTVAAQNGGFRAAAMRERCARKTNSDQFLPVIPNGVALSEWKCPSEKENYAVALGRICPEKGFSLAISAARQADCDFVLAGRVFPYKTHLEYFDEEISPRMDGRRRFVGPLGPAEKRRLLSRARCLLAPSLVPETSSLVALEAMALGTPVIAFRAGALAEIVIDGETGFLVNDVSEMADAIHRSVQIDPENCRRHVERHYSLDRMITAYLNTYQHILSQ